MEGLRALRFHQKYHHLCSKDERRSFSFFGEPFIPLTPHMKKKTKQKNKQYSKIKYVMSLKSYHLILHMQKKINNSIIKYN